MNWELLAAMLSAIFSFVGLVFAGWQIRESNRTRQLQLLSDTFKNIQETAVRLKDYKPGDKNIKEWDSVLFNSIELFAFLINEKFINNKKIAGFFDDAVVGWYEQIFMKNDLKEYIDNPKNFPEFKKLYHTIKLK